MPDICMCEGKDCPIKEGCYRFKAKPSQYGQGYFLQSPYENGKCDKLLPVKTEASVQKIEQPTQPTQSKRSEVSSLWIKPWVNTSSN